jgi:hypothetical protein
MIPRDAEAHHAAVITAQQGNTDRQINRHWIKLRGNVRRNPD